MCGIAGIIRFDKEEVDKNKLMKMTSAMKHRGPDDTGVYVDGSIGLGHRRLSIIDLSESGHQPMSNEDNSIWITFNGEIYNYKSFRNVLEREGHSFKSNCDTETIIHLYEKFGTACVDSLRGMFSFGIWDSNKKRFFAAVDRMRIKPFYYTIVGEKFIFASELRSILASGYVEPRLNLEAIHHYLSLQAIPVPMTIYRDIYTLPGGYSLTIQNNEVSVNQYWDMKYEEEKDLGFHYYKDRLRDLLQESISIRMMSDVPLGAFLSGGIDSSTIVALMSQYSNQQIKTYSIGYEIGGKDYDDTYFANLVSKKFNTDHTVKNITARDILNGLPGFISYLDQPSSDAINSYFVSQLASKDLTVVLSGQGGDELFAGYNSFKLLLQFMHRDAQWDKVPRAIQNLIEFLIDNFPNGENFSFMQKASKFLDEYGSFVKKYARIRMELHETEKDQLYSKKFKINLNGANTFSIYDDHLSALGKVKSTINRVSYLDLKTHLGDILMRDVDVMSMAFSLETRIPLIDHELVEFANTIPDHYKIKNDITKFILIESVKDILPDEVVNRPKLGFNFPFALWLRRELSPLVEYFLAPEIIECRGIFCPDSVNKLKESFYSSNITYRKVWGIILLELWLQNTVDENQNIFPEIESKFDKSMKVDFQLS